MLDVLLAVLRLLKVANESKCNGEFKSRYSGLWHLVLW